MLDDFVAWLATTPGSIALHESLYIYAIVETTHVVAITLFVGTIAMIDLRVLGLALNRVPVSQVLRRLLPWTMLGFLILIVTGALLFYAIPERTFHSLWFRAKVLLLVLAGLNAWRFHRAYGVSPVGWDMGPAPARARLSAIASLALWVGVIFFGRFIAYNWFDCDKPQPAFISAAIRESLWLFPVIEAVHLVGLAILGGALFVVDLRLMGGGLTRQSIAEVEQGARAWFLGALALMLSTGALLGMSEAVKLYDRPAFFLKMITLTLGLLLVFTVRRSLIARNPRGGPFAFAVGALSVCLWLTTAVAGRWIGFS